MIKIAKIERLPQQLYFPHCVPIDIASSLCYLNLTYFHTVFQDILNYLDSNSSGTGKITTSRESLLLTTKSNQNSMINSEYIPYESRTYLQHNNPKIHPSNLHHFQELIETEAELEKLTGTIQAFQKQPVPPPRRQV